MPFEIGHKLAPGGRREGAGAISAEERLITGRITKRLLRRLEKAADKIGKSYLQLAAGRKVKHYNQQTGEHLYTEIEVDAPTVRHAVERFVPAARQEIDISGGIQIVRVDVFDPDAESIDITPPKQPDPPKPATGLIMLPKTVSGVKRVKASPAKDPNRGRGEHRREYERVYRRAYREKQRQAAAVQAAAEDWPDD